MLHSFSFARFKASHAHCFTHQDCDVWLLAANTKYRQACKVVMWHNPAGKLLRPSGSPKQVKQKIVSGNVPCVAL